jgi:hypothetical protein
LFEVEAIAVLPPSNDTTRLATPAVVVVAVVDAPLGREGNARIDNSTAVLTAIVALMAA